MRRDAVVDEALVLVSNQAKLQNVKFECQLPKVSPVFGDFGQLRQACINVVINACDAMKEGGVLRITLAEDGDQVQLEFADTGTGIAPEYLTKVLDPFFTTKEKGTGLGLSVVYGIVERHGGTVEVASEVGKGTTVTFTLPPAAASPMAQAAPGQAPPSAADLGTGALNRGHGA